MNLGLAYWNTGDQEGAAKAFETVLESDPKSIDASAAWRRWPWSARISTKTRWICKPS